MNRPLILTIDDDRIMREVITQALGQEDFELLFAENGLEGLTLFREHSPDIILLDLIMPVMDGFQFLREVKPSVDSDFEVIVFTSHDTADRIGMCYDFGVQMLLRKPLIASEVVNVVRRSVALRKMKQEKVEAQRKAEEHRRQLIQADRMASLGVLVTGVAHEINNPNNFIMMNAPILLKVWQSVKPILDEYYQRHGEFQLAGIKYSEMQSYVPSLFDGIRDGAERIKNIVDGLKDYARHDARSSFEVVYINDALKRVLNLVSNMINKSTSFFELEFGKHIPPIYGNGQKIEQVMINLIQNACQALSNPSQKLTIKTSYDEGRDRVVVTVSDEGKGIPRKNMNHIVDPFFTTKRKIGGTGLGLAISMGIIKDHQGELIFDSEEGQGTTVKMVLPSCSAASNDDGERGPVNG